MVDCLLCLQCDQEIKNCIQVNSTEWNDVDVKKLIDKHLWPIDTIKENSWLCQPCLEELKDIHRFYNRIKEAHNEIKSLLKSETDLIEEDNKPKDLVLQMMLAPDVVIGQALETDIVIKQEIEELSELGATSVVKEKRTTKNEIIPDSAIFDNPVLNYYTSAISGDDGDDGDSDSDNSSKALRDTNSTNDDSDDNYDSSDYNSDSDFDSLKLTNGRKKSKKTGKKDKFIQTHYKIKCNKCDLPFETFALLCKHYSEEHKERGFVTCCEMTFYKRNLLVDHINFHLNPEYFKCKVCGKVFTLRHNLWRHRQLHEEKNFHCDICSKKFKKNNALERHKLTHLAQSKKENKSSFRREKCGRILSSRKQLNIHRQRLHPVDGEYSCHICPKVSPTARALKKHIRYAHEMSYDFKCTICDKAFKRADNLKDHMATHTGTPLYQCGWCSKTFNSSGNMYMHRKRIHPMEWEESVREKYSGNLPPNFKPVADALSCKKKRPSIDS